MSPELALLKGLLNKERYDVYRPYVDKSLIKSPEYNKILEIIDEQHNRNKDTGRDANLAEVVISAKLHTNHLTGLETVLHDLETLDISSLAYEEVFESIRKKNLAQDIALLAMKVSEGQEDYEKLSTFIEEHKNTQPVSLDEVNILSMDIRTYAEEEEGKNLLHWRLSWLNKSLGPLRKGNLGHVFAPTEVGKTAFWVSEVTWMATYVEDPIVVFFNEEDGKEVVYRMYSSMLGIPYKDIIADKDRYAQQFLDMGGSKIIFVDQAPLRMGFMEKVMAKYKPCFCVVDNADKVATKSLDRRDLEIHVIYKWLRELAKEYCPILSVAHADASAYGERYLTEGMMANSKVGKPAELDFIIGIGKEEGEGVARYFSLPKNKLRGDKDTVEQLRHGRWPVALQGEISRYVDTANE